MKRLILLLAAFPLIALGCRPQIASNQNANANTNRTITTNTRVVQANTNTPLPKPPSPETALQRLAVSFAERYGSFSNQSDFGNLESVLPYMTASFQGRTNFFITAERTKHRDTSVYYALTTRNSKVTTVTFDAEGTDAVFLVVASRSEAIGSPVNVRHYEESLRVTLKKESGVWRVDNAVWENKKL